MEEKIASDLIYIFLEIASVAFDHGVNESVGSNIITKVICLRRARGKQKGAET